MSSTATTNPWTRWALALAWFTVLWNLGEGAVSIAFGAAEESIALLGFGLDSWIEVGSAGVVLWRLKGHEDRARERTAARAIGSLLIALGVVAGTGGLLRLVTGGAPTSTLPGVVIALVSLSFMFALWRSKLRAARALDSRTLELDAACSRGCIELSVVLLAGSALQWLAPSLWWADGLAAIVLGVLIGREGLEGVRAAAKPDFDGGCCGCGK